MSEFRFTYPACAIAGKSSLTTQDIAILRAIALPQGVQCEADIVALLAINNSCREKCPEWTEYFVETIAAFLLDGLAPRGRIDDTKAGLILRLFSTGGVIHTGEELALTMALAQRAPQTPESLTAFALDQLRLALQSGAGAYAQARAPSQGVTAGDLAYVARVLGASQGSAEDTLSPLAAAVLEGIDAVALAAFNHAGWGDLMGAIRDSRTWIADGIAA